jgi:hypothetical protein
MSRATAKTLSVLRQLIRFANANANVRVVNGSGAGTRPSVAAASELEAPSWAGGLPRDTHAFPKMIMDIYRGNAELTNKAAIKAARAAAADALATFTSAKAQMVRNRLTRDDEFYTNVYFSPSCTLSSDVCPLY